VEGLPFERFRDAAGEGPLAELLPPGADGFRLSVREAFGDHRIVRVWADPASAGPVRLVVHLAPMSEDVADIETAGGELEPRHWAFLLRAAEFAGFWHLPAGQAGGCGLDGAYHAVEGLVGGRHHWVARWSPSAGRGGEFVSVLTHFLLELGEFVLDARDRAEPGAAPDRRGT
jgi:hypothetical protein